MSLFVYKMMVLESIPEKIVKTFESIISNFLWAGSNAKIALRILQGSKKQGGLKLANLRFKDMALKITWVQILEKETDYSKMIYPTLHPMGKGIFRCHTRPADAIQIGITSKFWLDLVKAWCHYNFKYKTRIDNQILWLNSDIKINNRIVFWKDCWGAGSGICLPTI